MRQGLLLARLKLPPMKNTFLLSKPAGRAAVSARLNQQIFHGPARQ
jgi:hypothetical protein